VEKRHSDFKTFSWLTERVKRGQTGGRTGKERKATKKKESNIVSRRNSSQAQKKIIEALGSATAHFLIKGWLAYETSLLARAADGKGGRKEMAEAIGACQLKQKGRVKIKQKRAQPRSTETDVLPV